MFGGGFFGGPGGPFGGFAEAMGGMPGGMPPGMGGGPPKSDNTRYYKLLGVDRTASEADLKKAHRKAALKHHPDKGGWRAGSRAREGVGGGGGGTQRRGARSCLPAALELSAARRAGAGAGRAPPCARGPSPRHSPSWHEGRS